MSNLCVPRKSPACDAGAWAVLITEIVLEPGKPIGHPIAVVDLEMMAVLGGEESTAQEFSDLLRQAHLRLEQVHPIRDSFFSIVEGSRS